MFTVVLLNPLPVASSDSIAGVRALLFNDTGSSPRSDVLGWAAGSFKVRRSERYVNLPSLSDRE